MFPEPESKSGEFSVPSVVDIIIIIISTTDYDTPIEIADDGSWNKHRMTTENPLTPIRSTVLIGASLRYR